MGMDMSVAGGDIDRAAAVLSGAGYAVALTGAGLSVASGIPAFRGPGGLWTKYGAPANLSYRAFLRDPQGWWERRLNDEITPGNPTYDLKAAVDRARPNAGHLALAGLERAGVIKSVITQNVDGLHRTAGSRNLLEIHGNRNYLRCTGCGWRRLRDGYVIGDLPPACAQCGGVIKPDTVMFGEPVPPAVLDACLAEARRCDVMLLVGTSGAVNPAAQLPRLAQEGGAQIIEVNPEPTGLTDTAGIALAGSAADALPQLAATVDRHRRRRAGIR